MYPRLHPQWHKSQVEFENPDLERFPNYVNATGYEVWLCFQCRILRTPSFLLGFAGTWRRDVRTSLLVAPRRVYYALWYMKQVG